MLYSKNYNEIKGQNLFLVNVFPTLHYLYENLCLLIIAPEIPLFLLDSFQKFVCPSMSWVNFQNFSKLLTGLLDISHIRIEQTQV